jgi:hypothetical protein
MKTLFINKIFKRFVTFFALDVDGGFSNFLVVVCGTFGLEILGCGETFFVLF